MLLSRFWFVALGLLLGAATFVLFLASSMYNRAGLRARSEALSSDGQVVSWYLRDDARERSARLIQFALNPDVAKFLQQSTQSEAKVPAQAREKLEAALKRVAADIPADAAFDAVFAVDQHGRVVAHLGYQQASGMEDFELGGYPVVADALHGYIRDDTLVLDRVYRVVARPVEFDLSQAPAGAIVGARIVDDRFARELSSRTGAAIAFYANGQRAAAAAPEGFDTAQLDQIISDLGDLENDPAYKEKGRSNVREIGGLLSVQYTRLPGEAWQLGAGYAVGRLPTAVSGPLGFFTNADDKDKERANLPLAIGIAVLAGLLGILFTVFEHTRPILVFKAEVGKLARGEIDALAPSKFRGGFRKIASDLNDGVDKILAKGGGPRRGPADLKEVLGDLPDQPMMSAFSLPGEPSPESSSVSDLTPGPARGVPSAPGRALPQPPSGPRLPTPPARPGSGAQLAAGAPPSGEWGAGAPDEAEWRGVYQDFVALKQQCGENVDGFTYEKFEQTLRRSRDQLISRHGATRVKFSVYVKEGKAALKANPIKE